MNLQLSPDIRRAVIRYANRENMPFVDALDHILFEGIKTIKRQNSQHFKVVDKVVNNPMDNPMDKM